MLSGSCSKPFFASEIASRRSRPRRSRAISSARVCSCAASSARSAGDAILPDTATCVFAPGPTASGKAAVEAAPCKVELAAVGSAVHDACAVTAFAGGDEACLVESWQAALRWTDEDELRPSARASQRSSKSSCQNCDKRLHWLDGRRETLSLGTSEIECFSMILPANTQDVYLNRGLT